MRLLLIPAAGGVGLGPLTNVLAIAEEAVRAGHEVALMGKDAWAPVMEQLGFQIYLAPTPRPYNGVVPPPYKLSDVVIGLGWVDEQYIRASIEAERHAIVSFKADAVVSMLQLTAPISAQIEGRPSLAIVSWADGPKFTSPLYKPEQSLRGWEVFYNRVLQEYGIQPINDICELAFLRSELRAAPTIPELQPELLSVPNVHFVGPLLSERMEKGRLPEAIDNWDGTGPMVYIYLAPGDIPSSQWIQTIIEAFEVTNFRVMVTLAPLNILPNSIPATRNIRFFERLPGTTAMERSDVVISHGGANTVINALLVGKPQIVFPDKYAERDYNGQCVARLRAGINCPTEQFTPQALRQIVEKVVANDIFKINAMKIAHLIRAYRGSRRVIELIERRLQ